jgi:serine/threonine protein kinase
MGRSSSDAGSVPVPSKDPDDVPPWERDGWRAAHAVEGDPLGEGGWGIVRRVRHFSSGQLRALKEPLHDSEDVRARFKREIEVQSKVKHRHVMPVLDHDPNFQWFTMPLAERTLYAAAPEMMNDDLAIAITHAARGLMAAHEKGYVHRDVKPSNILERSRGELDLPDWVVGDFGVVRRPDSEITSLKTKHAVGTEGFMAPEAALGRHANVTSLADVYSLGRTIAWATTGIRPEGFAPLEARWPWTTLVTQMTAHDPDKRPKDMCEVIAGIANVMKALRAQRSRNWGKPPAPALSANEESVLAAVFDLAWDPDQDDGEIAVSFHKLNNRSTTTATIRIALRRLVQLGYLTAGWYSGEQEPIRSYSPTQLAWDWANKNEKRIETILRPPPSPAANDDIPF